MRPEGSIAEVHASANLSRKQDAPKSVATVTLKISESCANVLNGPEPGSVSAFSRSQQDVALETSKFIGLSK
jgi:hypothetical protein